MRFLPIVMGSNLSAFQEEIYVNIKMLYNFDFFL